MIFHSIRWRLQLWHGVILCAVLTGFGFTAYRLQYRGEMRRVEQELQLRIGPLLETMRRPPPGERGGPGGPGGPGEPPGRRGPPEERERHGPPPREGGDMFAQMPREFRLNPNRAFLFEGETNAFYYVIWLRDGKELSRSASAPANVAQPDRIVGGYISTAVRTRGTDHEFYQFTPPGDCVLVGRSIQPELTTLRQFGLWLTGLGGGILGLGLAGGWWLATRAIRPINDISDAATQIARGDLSRRINAEDTDNELGRLATVLNNTFDRLQSVFEKQRQFTADASHELRTPVAVILSQTQATLARDRTTAEYKQTLEACQRAAQRMRSLTESLLVLARLDAGQESMKCETLDLSRVAEDCVEMLRPLAQERQITLESDLHQAECVGDAARLAQVITNLVNNAIVHNRAGGRVRIETRRETEEIVLNVIDTGPGIPADDLPQLFERFYRADQSRTGGTGGTGLGLAICKAITDAHRGSLTVVSQPGSGSTFTLRIPIARL